MKKLLVLGGNHIEKDVVTHAQNMGYYVIVTDNHEDLKDSPAKQIANEGWNISWSDLDTLELKCRDVGVDGVLAGFSEFRVENMIKLCERLNLPCYINLEQLDITRDKLKFKQELQKYNVPLVPEYDNPQNVTFPVIVKPTDRAGSIGIRVAYTQDELTDAINEAKQKSPTGSYIIEKYMAGCTKIDAYYIIVNDNIIFVGSNDTLMCPPEKGHEVMQSAWFFPSKKESVYLQKVDSSFRSFLKGIGVHNGYITLSAFIDENGDVFVFETGFRLSGELSYYYTERKYGVNYLDFLIDFSLGNPIDKYSITGDSISKDTCLSINFFGRDGRVKDVMLPQYAEGDVLKNYTIEDEVISNHDAIIFKKIAMSMTFGAIDQVLLKSKKICDTLSYIDERNKELIYYKPDLQSLKTLSGGIKVSNFYTDDELQVLFKSVGKSCRISKKACIYGADKMVVGNNVRIEDNCILNGNITIGNNVTVCAFCLFDGHAGITIGDDVTFAAKVSIHSGSDDYSGRSMFGTYVPSKFRKYHVNGHVFIQDHCLIGDSAIIMPGVTLAEGTAVGAQAFIKQSTEPFGIYAGTPARRIKERSRDFVEQYNEYFNIK